MKKFILCVIAMAIVIFSFGQSSNCQRGRAIQSQNINQNPMIVTNGSDNFNQYASLGNQYRAYPKNFRSAIFNTNLWLGGLDKAGKLNLAGAYYESSDFFAGILDSTSNGIVCILGNELNKIWSVSRYDIESHLADYQDNKKIDNPNPAIFSWAGKGNVFFKTYNNFELPNRSFATFLDTNNNGIYEPDLGEFPFPEGLNQNNIPELITWTVFNDQGIGFSKCVRYLTEGKSLPIEIQQTTWGFNCPNSNVLNHTNFVSYKVRYQGIEDLDSTSIGFFTDFDLGCPSDDFQGCSPNQNTWFVYNQDEVDGVCGGLNPWETGDIPVATVTLLNQQLNSFMPINTTSTNINNLPEPMLDPQKPLDFYRYMNGQFKDGTPFSEKELGYNPLGILPSTNFAFSGNPNDSTQFSMRKISKDKIKNLDTRGVASIQLGKLKRGQEVKIDLAYSMHREKGNTVSQNLDLMYKALDTLQNVYNQGFKNICPPKSYCSSNDCVYPGDVNKDGIVNYKDIALMGSITRKEGKERTTPLIFAPHNVENWAENFANNINHKHADTDGNGRISYTDNGIINSFYNRTTPNYQKAQDVYATQGDDIKLDLMDFGKVIDYKNLLSDYFQQFVININSKEIQSLGFQIEIDTNYIKIDSNFYSSFTPISTLTNSGTHRFSYEGNKFIIDMAAVAWASNETIKATRHRSFHFLGKALASPCTKIRVRNISAYKKDGTPLNITAKDLELCFTNMTNTDEKTAIQSPIQIAPNPFENELIVKNDATESVDIQVINVVGQVILQQQINAASNVRLNTSDLVNGIYFLKCSNGKQQWTTKVIKNTL